MKPTKLLAIILTLILEGACQNDKPATDAVEPSVSTFYLIRHAEKDRTDPSDVDPELTQRGLGRAMHWAEILAHVDFDAIYTTDYERTSMTAAPTSVKQDINVSYHNPEETNIEQFKADHLNQNVLVVGHSNSTPAFVNRLIGEDKYPQMDDDDNGSLFIVQLINGKATDLRLEFNCNCPD